MRLLKYFEYSVSDKNINEFRSCRVHASKTVKNINKIEKIMKKHNLNIDLIKKIKKENKKLNIMKNKKVLLDFLTSDDSKKIKLKNDMKIKILEFNDELCKIQRKLEDDLKNTEVV